ncbi:MAG: putative toxin-antitoxin system toxin component, PIN family [Thermoguttaceae bacterium]
MPNKRKCRLVVDTNIWVSLLMSKKLRRLLPLLFSDDVELLFSAELLHELKMVLGRPKLQKYYDLLKAEELLEQLHKASEFIDLSEKVQICRDPNDDFLLSLCKAGGADFLVTGEKDLLEIGQYGETQIVTISQFEAIS